MIHMAWRRLLGAAKTCSSYWISYNKSCVSIDYIQITTLILLNYWYLSTRHHVTSLKTVIFRCIQEWSWTLKQGWFKTWPTVRYKSHKSKCWEPFQTIQQSATKPFICSMLHVSIFRGLKIWISGDQRTH
jgi:hypothetical protein